MYRLTDQHHGAEAFFQDWTDFTDTTTPVTINPQPRLFLIARDFEGRTRSALDFLRENSLPVEVVPVTIYEDPSGRRIVDIDAEHEPVVRLPSVTDGRARPVHVMVNGRRVTVADLMEAGMVEPDEAVEFVRPRLNQHYHAVIKADSTFVLPDGSVYQSPSLAAMRSADLVSYDGWNAWALPRLGGTKLGELRLRYVEQQSESLDE